MHWNFSVRPKKISYTSGNGNREKFAYIFLRENFSHISGKGSFKKNSLYFRKPNYSIFKEKQLSYISRKVGIFKTLAYLELEAY